MTRNDSPPSSEARWREYPIARRGEWGGAAMATLVPALIGIGVTFGAAFAVGILAEEDLLPDPALSRSFDLFLRFAIMPIAVVGGAFWLIAGLGQLARDTAVSRAVLAAARDGADPRALPTPGQVELIVMPPGRILLWWAVAHAGLLGIFGLAGLIFVFVDFFGPGIIAMLIMLAAAVGAGWLARSFGTRIDPAHRERREEIAEHFSGEAERDIWRAAQRGEERLDDTAIAAERLIRLGAGVTHLGTGVAALALIALKVILVVTHPGAEGWPGGRLGERADLGSTTEAGVGTSLWVFAGTVGLAVLLALLGSLIEGTGQSRERAHLRIRLLDDDSRRPAEAMLRRQSTRHVPRLVQVLAALAGGGLIVGASGAGLAMLPPEVLPDIQSRSQEIFGPLGQEFLVILLISLAALVIAALLTASAGFRGAELRGALMARWPTAPKPRIRTEENEDGERNRVRSGPALQPVEPTRTRD